MIKTTSINIGNGQQTTGVIYLPDDATKKNLPLIIAAHGVGEAGIDPMKLYQQGLSKVLHDGFIPPFDVAVLCPQRSSWSDDPLWLPGILANLQAQYPQINVDRAVITGLSAGGWFAWGSIFNTDLPTAQKVAGVAALSAVTNDITSANIPLRKTLIAKILSIIGDVDTVVDWRGQVDFTIFLQNNGYNVEKVMRPGVGHGDWVSIYNNSFTWQSGTMNFWTWVKNAFANWDMMRAPTSAPPATPPQGAKTIKNVIVNYTDGTSITLP